MLEELRSGLGITVWKLVQVRCCTNKLITQGGEISVKDLTFQSATGTAYYDNDEQLSKFNFATENKSTKPTKVQAAYMYEVGKHYQLQQQIIMWKGKQPIKLEITQIIFLSSLR